MGAEKFCLKWNDFESNISSAFRDLRKERDFFDVTLACDDNGQIDAHKTILSACSPFFRNVLKRNPHQHPLLYLKGVKHKELQAVLDFMYMGEVNVAQEELNSFLAVAEDLRVKGLTQGNAESNDKPKSEPKSRARDSTPSDSGPPPKKSRPSASNQARSMAPPASVPITPSTAASASTSNDDDDIQEVVPVKSEPSANSSGSSAENSAIQHHANDNEFEEEATMIDPDAAMDDSYAEDNYGDYGSYEESYDESGMMDPNTGMPLATGADGNKEAEMTNLFTEIINSMWKEEKTWFCQACAYTSNHKGHMFEHIEAKHITNHPGYQCAYCLSLFNNKLKLRKHKCTKKPEKAPCSYIGFKTFKKIMKGDM